MQGWCLFWAIATSLCTGEQQLNVLLFIRKVHEKDRRTKNQIASQTDHHVFVTQVRAPYSCLTLHATSENFPGITI